MTKSYVWDALGLFERYGRREALVGDGRRFSYDDVRRTVLRLARALEHHGVPSGGSVLIAVGNPVEGPLLQLALHLLGCRSMWIEPLASRREIDAYAGLARADAFVYDPRTGDSLGPELAALTGATVLCLGPGGAGPDLLAGTDETPVEPGETAPESFLQTSGTTGVPKLVHHRESFYRQIMRLAEAFVAEPMPLLRHLSHSPMWLASGQITSLFNLFTGGVLFLRDEWDPAAFLATIETERINSTYVTPPLLYEVLDHPDVATRDCGSLFMLNVGSGAATPARLRQAIGIFGPVLRIVYGLSEAVVITAQPGLTEGPEHPERLASCGLPYGDVQVEVRADDGTVLGPGETGEIWVRSELNFAGYANLPELTAETIVDGWMRTRDLGHFDTGGYLYIDDRTADRILSGHWNIPVYCRPIEDAIALHPDVRAVAVVGVADHEAGEVPHAYVVTAPGATVTAAELIEQVSKELSEMWAPHGVAFVDRLPLTRSAKVDKKVLRSWYAAGG